MGYTDEEVQDMAEYLGRERSSTLRKNPNCPESIAALQYHVNLDEDDDSCDETEHTKSLELEAEMNANTPAAVADDIRALMDGARGGGGAPSSGGLAAVANAAAAAAAAAAAEAEKAEAKKAAKLAATEKRRTELEALKITPLYKMSEFLKLLQGDLGKAMTASTQAASCTLLPASSSAHWSTTFKAHLDQLVSCREVIEKCKSQLETKQPTSQEPNKCLASAMQNAKAFRADYLAYTKMRDVYADAAKPEKPKKSKVQP